ncbi:MAG: DNA primase large subunit PriL [Candidatus Syntrophoarchaeum sp.]|nr:DNA primase large subunit PriL [Candidatus Syntrophoarchaeum sp.]
MELVNIASYPFLHEASNYVKELGITPYELVYKKEFAQARNRGRDRVLDALGGEAFEKEGEISILDHAKESYLVTELLSYPFSRMILSQVGDPYLIRRFAVVEAKIAHTRLRRKVESLKREYIPFILFFGRDLGLELAFIEADKFEIHFLDYIHVSSILRDIEWKLVNRRLRNGRVVLSLKECLRLLQEFIRLRIEENLPAPVPKMLETGVELYLPEIREELSKRTARFEHEIAVVDPEKFPPCVRSMIQDIAAGINISHSARFTLTSFLLNIGLSVEDVIKVYRSSPDFDESKTRYQVEHIASKGYTPPSCSTIRTYGNCTGSCPFPGHPLTIYRKALESGG